MQFPKASPVPDLAFEVGLHENASRALRLESLRLARAAFGEIDTAPQAPTPRDCHWDEPQRLRLDHLHRLRVEVADVMSRSTRAASLCTAGVAELVEHFRQNHYNEDVKRPLVRACDVLEQLADIGYHLLATRSRVLDRIREEEAQADFRAMMLDDDGPVSPEARAELEQLLTRLNLQH